MNRNEIVGKINQKSRVIKNEIRWDYKFFPKIKELHLPRNESPCFFGANTEQDYRTRSEKENNYQSPIGHIID